jgi:hypothetical protein
MKLKKLIEVLTQFQNQINDDVDVLFQHKGFYYDDYQYTDLSDITIKTESIYKDNDSYKDDNVQTMDLVIQFEDDIIT